MTSLKNSKMYTHGRNLSGRYYICRVNTSTTSTGDEEMAYNEIFQTPVYPKDLDLRLGFAEAYNNQSDRRGGKRRQSATVAATAANVAAASLADYAGDEERPFR
jgi:hypothetical protein